MKRYVVFGYYPDEPQVVLDVVDAESDEKAMTLIVDARRDGYTVDDAYPLEEFIAHLITQRDASSTEIADSLRELKELYA